MNWWYIILGIVAWPFIKFVAKSINREVIRYRQRKFLKLINVTFPDNDQITLITIDTSDRRAMRKLQRELEEKYAHIYEVD